MVIRGAIHDVWREITRTDAPIACFFNSRMHLGPGMLAPGSKLAMRTPDGRNTGVVGEILEVVPPTRFSHTFKFTALDDPPCVVTYELREVPGGTEFTLIISECPAGTKTAKQMTQGATLIVNTLRSVIETGRPSFGTRLLFVLFKVMPAPRKCRSERWPVS
ncbi:MAG: SRPBCC domain-containing protein [Phycisphaerae bacterium]|nr:SRPBCC domain-containing protein [Phycisphaerae bacterium]